MLLLMAGGIRYTVCCDGCGIDAQVGEQENCEYVTEVAAIAVREWASTVGGWLWRDPNTDDQWLTCPECSAIDKSKLSVPQLKLVYRAED